MSQNVISMREWYERSDMMYKTCNLRGCSGVMMPVGDEVMCSDMITAMIRDCEEGGGG